MAGAAKGDALLAAPVERLFEGRGRMPLADVVQEIVQAHASGIDFREVGAGPELDSHMTAEGFNVSVRLDPATGFVSGGNAHNCGTWMDKMGESQGAGNKVPRAPSHGHWLTFVQGVPATPRDGAAVEIVGLVASAVRWLAALAQAGRYKHSGVTLPSGAALTFAEWAAALKRSFERHFYVHLVRAPIALSVQ